MATTRRIFLLLVVAANIGLAESSFARSSGTMINRPATSATEQRSRGVVHVVPPRPRESNWEDDTKSSRTNAEVTDYVPPWRDHQQQQKTNVSGGSRATTHKNDAKVPSSFARSVAQSSSGAGSEGAAPPPRAAPAPPTSRQENTESGTMLLRGVRWPLVRDPPGSSSAEYPSSYVRMVVAFLSTMSTWHLHAHNAHSPILAASVTTMIVSTCLDRRLGSVAMCGSLAGMSGARLVPDVATAASLGALSSMVHEASMRVRRRPATTAAGIGGATGTAAFLATSVLAWYRGIGVVVTRRARRGPRWGGGGVSVGAAGTARGGLLGDPILLSMVLYHVLGAVVTIWLREYSDDSAAADPVRASSVVGLLGSLFLGGDATAIMALYGGSFVGMSLPSRLMHGTIPGKDAMAVRPQRPLALFGSFAVAGAMAGVFHAMTIRYGYWNGGWGGKAGLCAFAGCWAYRVFGNAVDFLRSKRKK